jgi:hypothetical protein
MCHIIIISEESLFVFMHTITEFKGGPKREEEECHSLTSHQLHNIRMILSSSLYYIFPPVTHSIQLLNPSLPKQQEWVGDPSSQQQTTTITRRTTGYVLRYIVSFFRLNIPNNNIFKSYQTLLPYCCLYSYLLIYNIIQLQVYTPLFIIIFPLLLSLSTYELHLLPHTTKLIY